MPKTTDKPLRCSFCGKAQEQVKRLVAGPGVYICDECIELCREIIEEDSQTETASEKDVKVLKPAEMKAVLDQYVIGQDAAKRSLAVAVYNHYKRILHGEEKESEVELQKSNILMLGPTGCGKTMLAQTLARVLNVPFAIADATSLTEAGYVGEDVENILLKLIQAADYDIAKAERGIIYIDEVDKIARKSENPSITRDVSGEGVQQALLKILEGTVASVPPQGGRKHPQQEMLQINTKNILFICGGAFTGLEKIIQNRTGKKTMGFGATVTSAAEMDVGEVLTHILPEDLLKFGLIPEFVGRVPILVTLHGLDEDALTQILTEPKNALVRQYRYMLSLDDVELDFREEAVREVAKLALERKTGARGLRAIMENALKDIMFDVPSREDVVRCIVTAENIREGTQPELVLGVREPAKPADPTEEAMDAIFGAAEDADA